MRKIVSTISLLFIIISFSQAQKIVQQFPTFRTQNPQNMWGPGNALGINESFDIFPEFRPGPFYFDTSPYTLFRLEGLKFGAAINGFVDFGVGPFSFEIKDFTAGEIEIDYPTEITLILPDDNSFNPGETIVIKSEFAAQPTAQIITQYPDAGTIKLDLDLLFDVGMDITGCFGDCITTKIIPPASAWTPPLYDSELIIFEFNKDEITYICDNTGDPFAFLNTPFQCFLDISQPWEIDVGDSPLSITASLPYVETTTMIAADTRRLLADGDSVYVTPSLDVIATLGMIPGPVGTAIGFLDSSIDIPIAPDITGDIKGINIAWTLAGISLNLPITHNQKFDFKPEATTTITFPDEVEYVVHSLKSGDLAGKGENIVFDVGDSISIKYPCNYAFMDIEAEHSFKGRISNRTFDNMGLNVGMELFKFTVSIDDYVLFPEICIPIPFAGDLCTPELVLSAPAIPPLGPLYEDTFILLDDINFPDYFNRNWMIDDFNTVAITDPFRLQPRPLSPQFTSTNVTCSGDASGTVTTVFPNAAEPLEYKWSFESTDPNPVNIPAGTHSVKITDNNGCIFNEFITITEPKPLVLSIESTEIPCNGAATADIEVIASGGQGGYTYQWNSGETSPQILSKVAGDYSVAVSDAGGCSQLVSISISEPLLLSASIYNPVNPSCFSGDDGSLDLFVEGGSPPYTYSWSNLASSQAVDELVAGTYSVIVQDARGCTVTDQITIDEPSQLVGNINKISDVTCYAGENGSLTAVASGGTGPYEYVWYNENITLGENTASISDLPAGDYSVEIIDRSECRIVINISIFEPLDPLFASIETINLSCGELNDGGVNLTVEGGTSPYSYRWSNGFTDKDLTGLAAGVYEVEVTDAVGCIFGTKTRLTAPAELGASVTLRNVSCSDAQNGSIEIAYIKGGIPPYNILFSNGSTEAKIEDLADGLYSFTISDQSGCSYFREVEVLKFEGECLFIPSAFSPNGDGINDTWDIENIELYEGATVRVFNQWNIDVFRSSSYVPWDGAFNGNTLEPGVYYYIVDLKDGTPIRTGSLTIII